MAASKSNKNWSEIFNAPKQSSSFGDADLTIIQRHDTYTRFAKGQRNASGREFDFADEKKENVIQKMFEKFQHKWNKRR